MKHNPLTELTEGLNAQGDDREGKSGKNITQAGGNIFTDLGFPPDEAAALKAESQRIIEEKLGRQAHKAETEPLPNQSSTHE